MNPEEVICKVCRTRFIPSRHARNPMYCSDECKLIAKKERDRQRWALKGLRSKDFFNQKTRGYKDKFPEKSSSQHYAKNHNMRDTECLFCHNKDNLEIHHLIYRTPVMPEDVITVCKKCHGKMDIITKKIFSLAQEEAKKEKIKSEEWAKKNLLLKNINGKDIDILIANSKTAYENGKQEATEEIQKKVFEEIDKIELHNNGSHRNRLMRSGETIFKERLKQSIQNIFNSNSQTKHPIVVGEKSSLSRTNKTADIGDSPKIPDDGDTISKTALGESPDAQEGEK